MNKNAIKKYAIWARKELIERVSQRAMLYGISSNATAEAEAAFVNGRTLTKAEQKQRKALIEEIRAKGYEQVMEEAAYTWFNRFAALRFMEVNGYLPSHIRVFTDDNGDFKPQILAEAIHLQLDGLDMGKVYEFERQNRKEALFKYLLIVQCNALSSVLPGMFQKIEDYTELLLPDYLLREGSVIEQMVKMIPEEDWTDQVQIIGWLYQYYNEDLNSLVYDGSMSKNRITKDLLPAATTIYTPDWVARYMVENSLGRLWQEGHPDGNLISAWKYYLNEAKQKPEVEAQLAEIRKEYTTLKPKDILCIDPCMGSGHILCVLFDVLVSIYENYGYTTREAVASIVENNLWGLDVCDRAAQLAYFAVMMKARQFDRRFFTRKIQPHVYAIAESNHVSPYVVHEFCQDDKKLAAAMQTIIRELHDAKEYGSILTTTPQDWSALYARFDEIRGNTSVYKDLVLALEPLVQTAQTLAQKYHVVVTNPPYMGNSRFSSLLDRYVKSNYADEKSDLSMVMLKRALSNFSKVNGFISFVTTSSWMFLASFEKLRKFMLSRVTIESLVDFGTELFDGKVGHNPIVAWVNRNACVIDYTMSAVRLVDYCYSRRDEKLPEFFEYKNRYTVNQKNFSKIPGSPVAYWVSENFTNAYENNLIGNIGTARSGLQTGNNDLFLKYWYEVSINDIAFNMQSKQQFLRSQKKWAPQIKGGAYRKWYGNFDYVVDWSEDGKSIRACDGCRLNAMCNDELFFIDGITWSHTTSGVFGARYLPQGNLFNVEAPTLFVNQEKELYILGMLNSCVIQYYLDASNATMHYLVGNILKLPYIYSSVKNSDIKAICKKNINVSRKDWDSFEISWDFRCSPMLSNTDNVANAWRSWQSSCEMRFQTLKFNEEELNRIFIDIYGLQDELVPDVADKDVTVYRFFDTKDDIPESMRGSNYALTKQDAVKSLISYAVGCMFGRYSLDEEGLIYAGGRWDDSRYKSFPADKDAIIPVCDNEYFQDDIVGLFVKFIKTVYGEDTLEENLSFIANALEGRGTSREVIRNYFLNDFYKDHLKTYKKRPIYWLFDSGKKNGFKCLIYMHRYQQDTIARIRTDYVHEQQSRYRTAIADMERQVGKVSTSERVRLNKKLKKLRDQSEELSFYEEKIHHLADQYISIDLDDGVKVNYAKFQDVLAKLG